MIDKKLIYESEKLKYNQIRYFLLLHQTILFKEQNKKNLWMESLLSYKNIKQYF